jgi:hypothetical protein
MWVHQYERDRLMERFLKRMEARLDLLTPQESRDIVLAMEAEEGPHTLRFTERDVLSSLGYAEHAFIDAMLTREHDLGESVDIPLCDRLAAWNAKRPSAGRAQWLDYIFALRRLTP